MPYKALVPCKHPGCSALVKPGEKYCDKHKPLHVDEARPSSKRGYNSRWARESKQFLRAHPLCVRCLEKDPPQYTRATVVDHIVPHRGDPKLFWTDRIGNPCVRDAMIRRLGMKTRHRRIIIDSRGNSCGGGGGQNLYEPWPQGPPPPLLLIFANFIGRGCRASRWSAKCTCRMRPARSSFP